MFDDLSQPTSQRSFSSFNNLSARLFMTKNKHIFKYEQDEKKNQKNIVHIKSYKI